MREPPPVNDSVNSNGVGKLYERIRHDVYVDGPPFKVGWFQWQYDIADGLFSSTGFAATRKRAERKAQRVADERAAGHAVYDARREASRLRRAALRELDDA